MPCDYSKYPENWFAEIRPAILERAEDHCELCGVQNHIVIQRSLGNRARYRKCGIQVQERAREIWAITCGVIPGLKDEWCMPILVVLTVAHLDHDIKNNDGKNLRALCQLCHNRHDSEHRQRNRKARG